MRELTANLARRPFVNTKPVTRATLVLWVLGVLLAAWNGWLYWRYFEGSGEKARRLTELGDRVAEERARIGELEGALRSLDLGRQNATVAFLNIKIAERAFAWSQLFDHLAELLPADVRLTNLRPAAERDDRRRRAVSSEGEAVRLHIQGEAKNDEALLALVDALFAHPAFEEPDLEREARQEGGLVQFDLETRYLLHAAGPGEEAVPPAPESPAGPAEVAGSGDGEGNGTQAPDSGAPGGAPPPADGPQETAALPGAAGAAAQGRGEVSAGAEGADR